MSAPVPVHFFWTLNFGFGTLIWDFDLGLDLGLTNNSIFTVCLDPVHALHQWKSQGDSYPRSNRHSGGSAVRIYPVLLLLQVRKIHLVMTANKHFFKVPQNRVERKGDSPETD